MKSPHGNHTVATVQYHAVFTTNTTSLQRQCHVTVIHMSRFEIMLFH